MKTVEQNTNASYYFSVIFKALYISLQLQLISQYSPWQLGLVTKNALFYYLADFIYVLDFFESREETLPLEQQVSICTPHTPQASMIWLYKLIQPLQSFSSDRRLMHHPGVHKNLRNIGHTLLKGKYQAKNQGWTMRETKPINQPTKK